MAFLHPTCTKKGKENCVRNTYRSTFMLAILLCNIMSVNANKMCKVLRGSGSQLSRRKTASWFSVRVRRFYFSVAVMSEKKYIYPLFPNMIIFDQELSKIVMVIKPSVKKTRINFYGKNKKKRISMNNANEK